MRSETKHQVVVASLETNLDCFNAAERSRGMAGTGRDDGAPSVVGDLHGLIRIIAADEYGASSLQGIARQEQAAF
jgi:hypothetical protein